MHVFMILVLMVMLIGAKAVEAFLLVQMYGSRLGRVMLKEVTILKSLVHWCFFFFFYYTSFEFIITCSSNMLHLRLPFEHSTV